MKNIGYFTKTGMIDNVARAIAKSQGLNIPPDVNVIESTNPRHVEAVKAAEAAIAVIEAILIVEE